MNNCVLACCIKHVSVCLSVSKQPRECIQADKRVWSSKPQQVSISASSPWYTGLDVCIESSMDVLSLAINFWLQVVIPSQSSDCGCQDSFVQHILCAAAADDCAYMPLFSVNLTYN